MRKSRFGIPYFEIGLATILVCILALVWFERAWYYRELTEKAVFEMNVRQMRSALQLEKARRILAGEALSGLERSNPVRYLEKAPEHYHGELDALDEQLVRKSGWTFVRKEGALYYSPLIHRHLRASAPVLAMRIDNDLRITTPYQWF
jgi:hypothetical protein